MKLIEQMLRKNLCGSLLHFYNKYILNKTIKHIMLKTKFAFLKF